MKAVKILAAGIAGLVILVALGIGVALVVIDGNFVKARLERAMKEKNRTLVIEGSPQLKLFPVAGLSLGKTTLSEPGGGKTFVALESAEVAVRVMPLLGGALVVDKVVLAGAHVRVQNAVVYDVAAGVRYEDDIERVQDDYGRQE